MGRWRTLGDAIRRLVESRELRGVIWTVEGDRLVGRDGTFEMRLRLLLPPEPDPVSRAAWSRLFPDSPAALGHSGYP